MEKALLLVLVIVLFFGCSDDEPILDCFQKSGEDIIATVEFVSGTIRDGACGFVIDPHDRLDGNPTGLLYPCNSNFGKEFRKDGVRVEFSGFIYESEEDTCADLFEITTMTGINERL